jgi:hypothetical protein
MKVTVVSYSFDVSACFSFEVNKDVFSDKAIKKT